MSFAMSTDSRWGNSIYITFFRNWSTTTRLSAWPGYGVPTQPALPSTSLGYGNPLLTYSSGGFYYEDNFNRMGAGCGSHHWWYSYVGNVLGKSDLPLLITQRSTYKSFQNAYVYQVAGSSVGTMSDSNVPIWVLGLKDGAEPASGGNGLDSSVLPLTLRDGNYDYYTNSVKWHGIGGSSESQTTPPAVSTLPNSLYLTSKPEFFGSYTWPWVDPTGSTKVYTLPAKARFDAGVMF
jgi:hypothetical protein